MRWWHTFSIDKWSGGAVFKFWKWGGGALLPSLIKRHPITVKPNEVVAHFLILLSEMMGLFLNAANDVVVHSLFLTWVGALFKLTNEVVAYFLSLSNEVVAQFLICKWGGGALLPTLTKRRLITVHSVNTTIYWFLMNNSCFFYMKISRNSKYKIKIVVCPIFWRIKCRFLQRQIPLPPLNTRPQRLTSTLKTRSTRGEI